MKGGMNWNCLTVYAQFFQVKNQTKFETLEQLILHVDLEAEDLEELLEIVSRAESKRRDKF